MKTPDSTDTAYPEDALRRKSAATGMLVLLTMIWGGTFPATKAALAVTDPMHFIALRFMIAVLILTPFMWKRLEHNRLRIRSTLLRKNPAWLYGVWVGVFMAIGYTLQTQGMKFTTASRSGFFTGLLVVLAPILANLFRTSRTPSVVWVGLPISVAGGYLLADPESGGLNFGDLLTIGCALTFAIQMVTLEAVSKKTDDVWMLTYMQMIMIGAVGVVWSVIEGNPFRISTVGMIALGYNTILGGIMAVWMQTRFQPDTSAGHAALIFTLEPVFASIFAWMLLGETWTGRGLIGAGFILTAMLWSSFTIIRFGRNKIGLRVEKETG